LRVTLARLDRWVCFIETLLSGCGFGKLSLLGIMSSLSDKFSQSYSHLGIYPDKMAFGQGVLVIEGKSYSLL
jgi:hypothetical protein